MTRRGWVLFIALSLVWGIPYLMIRVAVEHLDPAVVAGGRCLIGALVLLPVAIQRGQLRGLRPHWKMLLIFTLVEIVAAWWLLGWGETKLTSSTAGLLIAAVPLLAAILLTWSGQDRLGAKRIVGLLVGFGGVAALVGFDIHFDNLTAVAAVLGTVVCYSIGAILISRLSALPPLGVISVALTAATIVYLPFALPRLPSGPVPTPALLSVVGLGLVCTAGAFLLMFALVKEAGAGRATVITYINPAVAIVLGIAVLDEQFTAGVAIGFPLVIIGAILATSRARLSGAENTAETTDVTAQAAATTLAAAAGDGTTDPADPGADDPDRPQSGVSPGMPSTP